MLPKALKSCPKSNKLPNLVTLVARSEIIEIEGSVNGDGGGFFEVIKTRRRRDPFKRKQKG